MNADHVMNLIIILGTTMYLLELLANSGILPELCMLCDRQHTAWKASPTGMNIMKNLAD